MEFKKSENIEEDLEIHSKGKNSCVNITDDLINTFLKSLYILDILTKKHF